MSGQYDSFLDALPNGWTFDRLKDVVALRNEKTAELSAEEDYLELEDIEAGTRPPIRVIASCAQEIYLTLKM